MTSLEHELLNAAKMGEMMLGIEARSHRDNQQVRKAEAVEQAMAAIRKVIDKAESTVRVGL
jgi:hypothetical protein